MTSKGPKTHRWLENFLLQHYVIINIDLVYKLSTFFKNLYKNYVQRIKSPEQINNLKRYYFDNIKGDSEISEKELFTVSCNYSFLHSLKMALAFKSAYSFFKILTIYEEVKRRIVLIAKIITWKVRLRLFLI